MATTNWLAIFFFINGGLVYQLSPKSLYLLLFLILEMVPGLLHATVNEKRDGGTRCDARDGGARGVSFKSAAPSLDLASSNCKNWPASYLFTATYFIIQLLHIMIDREANCVRDGGACGGVRDGDTRGGVRDDGVQDRGVGGGAHAGDSPVSCPV